MPGVRGGTHFEYSHLSLLFPLSQTTPYGHTWRTGGPILNIPLSISLSPPSFLFIKRRRMSMPSVRGGPLSYIKLPPLPSRPPLPCGYATAVRHRRGSPLRHGRRFDLLSIGLTYATAAAPPPPAASDRHSVTGLRFDLFGLTYACQNRT